MQIGFVGTMYSWHPWKSFLKVLSTWVKENNITSIRLNLYGINNQREIEDYILSNHNNLRDKVIIYPRLPNDKLIEELVRNNVVLLFNYYSYMSTKIYDYLAVKRKILLCYENDVSALKLKEKYYSLEDIEGLNPHLQAEVIEETESGIVVQNEAHLTEVLNELWEEFKEKGEIECNSTNIENYSRKIQVQRMVEKILEII